MPETVIVKGAGITLELLLHRRHGVRGRELLETALRLNPGLARRGLVLPPGAAVVIPDLPPASAARRQVATLFG